VIQEDVLRYIFELAFHNDKQVGWIFSHVSTLWRAIAVDTPLLWTELTLHYPQPTMLETNRWHTMLPRSKAAPLQVSAKVSTPTNLTANNRLAHTMIYSVFEQVSVLRMLSESTQESAKFVVMSIGSSLQELVLKMVELPDASNWYLDFLEMVGKSNRLRRLILLDVWSECTEKVPDKKAHTLIFPKLEDVVAIDPYHLTGHRIVRALQASPIRLMLGNQAKRDSDPLSAFHEFPLPILSTVRILSLRGRQYTTSLVFAVLRQAMQLEELTLRDVKLLDATLPLRLRYTSRLYMVTLEDCPRLRGTMDIIQAVEATRPSPRTARFKLKLKGLFPSMAYASPDLRQWFAGYGWEVVVIPLE